MVWGGERQYRSTARRVPAASTIQSDECQGAFWSANSDTCPLHRMHLLRVRARPHPYDLVTLCLCRGTRVRVTIDRL
jgi:hypothetical protein